MARIIKGFRSSLARAKRSLGIAGILLLALVMGAISAVGGEDYLD